MAKSAIYTGIVALLKHNNLTVENVDRVYVAGGFGFHLKPASAVNIGLFPESFQNIIYSLGNTSLEGACLLVRDFKNQPLDIDKYNINVLELTFDEYFKDNLIENMTFNKK